LFELGERAPDRKIEQRMRALGFSLIAGVDEAGRGPLAGPVVAGAVILPEWIRKRSKLWLVRDSKKLNAAQREELFDLIFQEAVAVGAGEADSKEIDDLNIFQASLLAMERAVKSLSVAPDFALVDGICRIEAVPSRAVKKGDLICLNIAAASIIAKVTRDRRMLEFDRNYPGYGFALNKGYATAAHLKALAELGPCGIHRRSFEPVKLCAARSGCAPNDKIATEVARTMRNGSEQWK